MTTRFPIVTRIDLLKGAGVSDRTIGMFRDEPMLRSFFEMAVELNDAMYDQGVKR